MNDILQLIIDIASTPALLVALIAVLGLLLQGKGTSDVVKGGVKTFVGFLVLTTGAGAVEQSLIPFGEMFQQAFNMQGVVPNNEAIVAVALNEFGTTTALIMLLGMVFNIVIARFTKFKYIFLTGHHTLYMACMIAVILAVVGFNTVPLIILGGITLGIIMTLSPAIVQPYMRQLTGKDQVALGHFSAVTYALSGFIGSKVGDKTKSTEGINFPKGLGFLRDSTVSIAITMAIIYLVVALFAGGEYITENLSDGVNHIMFAIQQAGTFAAGVFVILAGVRLILAEIVPAFKGISQKLVPNAKPALDCPVVFPYAPNAVLIGFFASFVGGIVSMLAMVVLGSVIILPGVVPHFFVGATAGVMGNASGGIKGSVIGAFINGIVISLLPALLLPVLGDLGFAGSTFSDGDFAVSGLFLGILGQYGGQIAVIVGIIAIIAMMFGLTIFSKDKENLES
ncbi:PTS system IIC component, L-Asc family [Marinilactibacillus piezotolerans]|uniref:Ascorbate-specific PTS system EIIC component n=1 Tax=Marinilactibacillus piezotolerans TaxID=258723 RepID=A0A1I4AS23_9LACT|nr:PTS ascorbate transporter subunit IIC [Marinilactibacillus piezotolerans]SFK59030.1 PTS system IIC component, L-Asc family [Marinilactibacillus piezotolerans]